MARETIISLPDQHNEIMLAGTTLIADPNGVIYWPRERLLAVADLHLEKGSSYAARGVLLPPYDTAATLTRLARVVARFSPRVVLTLGDNFHDGDGPARLADGDRDMLRDLQRGREWIWLTGNHDPRPAQGIGGEFCGALAIGALMFRHEPRANSTEAEIAGHLHPIARVRTRGRIIARRCFACDGKRLVMPAFGAFTGGLNVRDRAFAAIFDAPAFTAHMLGEDRVFAIAATHCLPD